jgi:hypothetical protein
MRSKNIFYFSLPYLFYGFILTSSTIARLNPRLNPGILRKFQKVIRPKVEGFKI